jgi:hypothetical protein
MIRGVKGHRDSFFDPLDFIQSIAKYISKGKLPTSAQYKRLVKIVTKAEDFGYIMTE